MPALMVVMPVYNEAIAIEQVVKRWLETLQTVLNEDFCFCIINDGSTDQTAEVLNTLRQHHPTLHVIHQANKGHGQACRTGYEYALTQKASWILQIDSDGQSDPKHFETFWHHKQDDVACLGLRLTRGDGFLRWLASRALSLVILARFGCWISDANVPYRLFSHDLLSKIFPYLLPTDDLINVFMSIALRQNNRIKWLPITFPDRLAQSGKFPWHRMWSSMIRFFYDASNTRNT